MDATRKSDGMMVMLKRTSKSINPYEVEIGLHLSSPPLSSDPRNHTCPIYAVLQDPMDDQTQIIVMPMLREYRDPDFLTVGEAVEFFRQVFEVGVFLGPSLR